MYHRRRFERSMTLREYQRALHAERFWNKVIAVTAIVSVVALYILEKT